MDQQLRRSELAQVSAKCEWVDFKACASANAAHKISAD
jgi:hypothetical protein